MFSVTTKKQKRKQSPLKWVVMMIVLIFLFFSNKIVAESYAKFRFFEDEQFQYLDYLPIKLIKKLNFLKIQMYIVLI